MQDGLQVGDRMVDPRMVLVDKKDKHIQET